MHDNPDSINWSSTTIDVFGNLVKVGNTNVDSNYANISTVVMDSESGEILWQGIWNGPQNGYDYGTSVVTDQYGSIYVAGISHYSTDSTFDIVLIKYDWQGHIEWTSNYNGEGLNNFPVALFLDNFGNIYVSGSSEGYNTGLDFITLKFDSEGQLQWDVSYDYNNLVDIAGFITANENGDTLTIAGGSESSNGIWDYTIILYDIHGNEIGIDRQPTVDADIYKPRDLVKDENNNYYLVCHELNSNYSIKLIKLNATLQTQWIQVHNSANNEGGNTVANDSEGNVYIGGWIEESAGIRRFLLIKYDSNGNYQWNTIITPDAAKQYSEITKINIDNDKINITGFVGDGKISKIVTGQINVNGTIHWVKIWQGIGNIVDYPTAVNSAGNNLFVSGRTLTAEGMKWITIKYETYEKDTSIYYDSNYNPIFSKHELVVRFDTSAVIHEAVNDLGISIMEFGTLDYFLKPDVVADIYSALEGICSPNNIEFGENSQNQCPITVLKIFPQLKTFDTVSISRLGDVIKIPPFWATFNLVFPEGIDISQVADALNSLFPIVKYSHPNPVAHSTSANDPHYDNQASLRPNIIYSNAHINIEEAWSYQSGGKSNIRVGVFDNGILWQHEDFNFDGVNDSSSVIAGGWDFVVNAFHKSVPVLDVNNHGTPSAGIIGATKNNNKGIAGIAGMDANNPSNSGVSVYDMKVTPLYSIGNPFVKIYDAIVTSSLNFDSSKNYAYGLHIMNNSWGFFEEPIYGYFIDTNITLLREAIHFANRMHVTFTAAVGNSGLFPQFKNMMPAHMDKDWVLCVGGTGTNGEYKSNNNGEPGWAANTSWAINIAAPATSEIIRSTAFHESNNGTYSGFSGTSAATPNVSGLAALLMSYLNDPDSNWALAPEDVAYILQNSATDVGPAGRDSLTGFGRINAGEALK